MSLSESEKDPIEEMLEAAVARWKLDEAEPIYGVYFPPSDDFLSELYCSPLDIYPLTKGQPRIEEMHSEEGEIIDNIWSSIASATIDPTRPIHNDPKKELHTILHFLWDNETPGSTYELEMGKASELLYKDWDIFRALFYGVNSVSRGVMENVKGGYPGGVVISRYGPYSAGYNLEIARRSVYEITHIHETNPKENNLITKVTFVKIVDDFVGMVLSKQQGKGGKFIEGLALSAQSAPAGCLPDGFYPVTKAFSSSGFAYGVHSDANKACIESLKKAGVELLSQFLTEASKRP